MEQTTHADDIELLKAMVDNIKVMREHQNKLIS